MSDKYNDIIDYLSGVKNDEVIHWPDYCHHAGIPMPSKNATTREQVGFINERNTFRAALNDMTMQFESPWSVQPYMDKSNGANVWALQKVAGASQLENRIEHHDKQIRSAQRRTGETLTLLKKDESLPDSSKKKIERLLYAGDVLAQIYDRSFKIAVDDNRKLFPSSTMKRITGQSIDEADEMKRERKL